MQADGITRVIPEGIEGDALVMANEDELAARTASRWGGSGTSAGSFPPLLVETRFQPPRSSHADVWRPAVADLLDRACAHRVTLVAAPTGYGKTTALASWLRSRPESIGWLSLEPSDDREARFATYLVTAVRRAVPDVGAAALAALQDPKVDIETDVIGSLVNELARQDSEVLLVLDDLQAIGSRGCHELLAAFVAEMPQQLRLIISTRIDPALPIGRLRARGELGEVRVNDLRFSPAEVRSFFDRRLEAPLDPDLMDALIERTEGWPAALNLVALSLAGEPRPDDFVRSFAGSNAQVVDYLVSEILDRQSAEVRRFLLRTSVLQRLTGELCDALTGGRDGQARLAELRRSHLFVSGYEGDPSYRYHRLFREAMRAQLAIEEPEAAPRLLRVAARWHGSDGTLDEALSYALAARDHELAGELLARHYLTFTRGGHLAELRAWLAALDSARLGPTRGAVAFVAALEAGMSGEGLEVVEMHLAELIRHGTDVVQPEGIPSAEAGALFVRAAFVFDDASAPVRAAEALLAGWPDHHYLAGVARMALGYAAYLRGDDAQALEAVAPLGGAVDGSRPLMTLVATAVHGLAALRSGALETGRRMAHDAIEAADSLGVRETPIMAIVHETYALALATEGDVETATAVAHRAARLARPTRPLPRAATLLTQATILAQAGDVAGATAGIAEARSLLDRCVDPASQPARLRTVLRLVDRTVAAQPEVAQTVPTPAEFRVLRLLPSTLTQREIADALYLSPDTVKTHTRRLYRKLDASSRAEAIERARGAGLLN
jgi:LuxR family maltose regulon positive regulatory protein